MASKTRRTYRAIGTARQIEAMRQAAASWDRSFHAPDMRVLRPLVARGFAEVTVSTESYYSPRKGYWVSRDVITDVKITPRGIQALREIRK